MTRTTFIGITVAAIFAAFFVAYVVYVDQARTTTTTDDGKANVAHTPSSALFTVKFTPAPECKPEGEGEWCVDEGRDLPYYRLRIGTPTPQGE